ncbi:efflux transporter outer membrane subunit, partial [bacterium]|nr:efflux transporter outer membrane subunit [candidate division CSSED10-310 bacterium]
MNHPIRSVLISGSPAGAKSRSSASLRCRVWSVAVCFGLAGCMPFRPGPTPPVHENVPAEYTLFEPVAPRPDAWWTVFESDDLNRLMEQALNANLTIRESYARLAQVRAVAEKAGVDLFPELDGSAGASASRQRIDLGGATDGTETSKRYSLGLSMASYEIDLWGSIRSTREAALRDTAASVEDVRAAFLTISAELATRWAELMVQMETLHVLDRQLESNRQSLDLMETRFHFGRATVLDVYQQRQSVTEIEALIPSVAARIGELRNEIAVLIGDPPGTDIGIDDSGLPDVPIVPDPGIPMDVLAQRPDVRKAGLALEAAEWRVSAARADRLPAIRLSASLTFSADAIDQVLTNWIGTLAAGLTGPIVDAGRRRVEVERTRAVVDERLVAYRRAAL